MRRKIYTAEGEIFFDLTFKRNVKSINIRIKEDGKVLVSAPVGVKFSLVDEAVANHSKFIQKHLEKAIKKQKMLAEAGCEQLYLLGNPYKLIFVANEKFLIKMTDSIIYVYGSGTKDELFQKLAKKIKAFAQKYIYERFCYYCKKFDVQKDIKVSFSSVKSWWGKCNATKGIITFNYRLISRPQAAIDGVICHELAHLKVGNHQKQFYDYLQTLDPNYKQNRKLLSGDKYYANDKLL